MFRIIICLILLLCHCGVSGQSSGRNLRPYSQNPMYWEYRGSPVLLLGATIDDNLFQRTHLQSHLDSLKEVGGNYIRNTMSDRDAGNVRAYHKGTDGKYDLNKWNDVYWNRFENLLRLTAERDIVVQVEVWDRFDHSRNEWKSDPYNPKNNINYSHAESRLDSLYPMHPGANRQPFFYTVPGLDNNPLLLEYQQAFVRKLLSVSLAYDHVLYCIDNETSGEEAWAVYWRDFIKSNTHGKEIFITQMWDTWDVKADMHKRTLDHPERYDFVDLSQNSQLPGYVNWENQQYVFDHIKSDPRPVNSTKIYGSDRGPWLDRGITSEHAIQTFFRNLTGGFASSRFHRPPSGLGLSDPSIHAIKTIRKIEGHVRFWNVIPRMDLLKDVEQNEAYLAAREGESYLVYFTKGGSVSLDLRGHRGKLRLKWITIRDSSWSKTRTLKGGAVVSLEAPHAEGCVGVLY